VPVIARFPIGSTATLADLEGDPHPLLARLRAREPVSWVPALGAWLVTRRDLAVRVLRDPVTFTVDDPRFSTARVVGPSMLSLDGAEHTRHRAPFERPFRRAEVRTRFAAFVEAEAERLIAAIRPQGAAELRRSVAGPLAAAAVAQALGLTGADAATLLSWYDAIVGAVSGMAAGHGVTAAGNEAFAKLRAGVETAISSGARSSLLAAVAAGGSGLSAAEVVSNAAVLMFGGIETTEGMIANAVLHLLDHPDQLDLVRGDPGLVGGAVEESLRLEPAAAMVDRYATRDVELGAASIRQGDLVSVSISGANRDPTVFPEPDRVDVRRANARLHLAFAHGLHFCLGVHLARLEAQCAVRRLLHRLPGLRPDPGQPRGPHGLVFRKPPTLHVLWDEGSTRAASG
jgi:cytochrome P450